MDISDKITIFVAVLGAVLAYVFGRFQYRIEYKENIKQTIFNNLLIIDLPKAYADFYENCYSSYSYNALSTLLKEVKEKCSVLFIYNSSKYNEIRNLISEIDELLTLNTYHIEDGVLTPRPITDISQINEQKKKINKKMRELYCILGINRYKGILYTGFITKKISYLYLWFINRNM